MDTTNPYGDDQEDAELPDEWERAELTREEAFDILHPRDEQGHFITREYDISPEDLDYFREVGAL